MSGRLGDAEEVEERKGGEEAVFRADNKCTIRLHVGGEVLLGREDSLFILADSLASARIELCCLASAQHVLL